MKVQFDLEKCPFCSSLAELFSVKVEHLIDDRMIDAYFVMCSAADCGCLTQYCETPEKAAETWNRRDGT